MLGGTFRESWKEALPGSTNSSGDSSVDYFAKRRSYMDIREQTVHIGH